MVSVEGLLLYDIIVQIWRGLVWMEGLWGDIISRFALGNGFQGPTPCLVIFI